MVRHASRSMDMLVTDMAASKKETIIMKIDITNSKEHRTISVIMIILIMIQMMIMMAHTMDGTELFPNLNDSIKNLVYDMDDISVW